MKNKRSSIVSFEEFILMNEASYKGNIGIMELTKFYERAKTEDPLLFKEVQNLIQKGDSKKVWEIVQDFLKIHLINK